MSRATETVVASQASVTSAGESLMATAWAAARCMGISFHDALARVGAVDGGEEVDQRPQARALGGAEGNDVEEVLVAEDRDGPAPAVLDLGLSARQERRIGYAQGDADEGASEQVGAGGP